MQPFHESSSPDFSKPEAQHAFVHHTENSKDLLQKELDVNKEEQVLLSQRILIMKSFINNIPSSDPQYSMLSRQLEMDQIELDELKIRESVIKERFSN